MRKLILVTLLLSGCASTYRLSTPYEVATIPVDCLNRTAHTRALEEQLGYPKPTLMSKEDYEAHRSAVKYKMWQIRASCQSM